MPEGGEASQWAGRGTVGFGAGTGAGEEVAWGFVAEVAAREGILEGILETALVRGLVALLVYWDGTCPAQERGTRRETGNSKVWNLTWAWT